LAFNPLRQEADAFRVVLYVVGVLAVIVAVVLIVRAFS
jgi:predicted nucleic acid-binding Zn ribbon protein